MDILKSPGTKMCETRWSRTAILNPACVYGGITRNLVKDSYIHFHPKVITPETLVTGLRSGHFAKLLQWRYWAGHSRLWIKSGSQATWLQPDRRGKDGGYLDETWCPWSGQCSVLSSCVTLQEAGALSALRKRHCLIRTPLSSTPNEQSRCL